MSPQTGLREIGTSQIVAFVGVHFGGAGDDTAAHRAHQQPGRLTHTRTGGVRDLSGEIGDLADPANEVPAVKSVPSSTAGSVRPAAQPYATSLKPISGSGPRSSLVSRSTSDTSRQIRVPASSHRWSASGIRGRRPASSVRLASKTREAKTAASCG